MTIRRISLFLAFAVAAASPLWLSGQQRTVGDSIATGRTDIGPDATAILDEAFITQSKKWLFDASAALTFAQVSKADSKLWLDLATEFSGRVENAITDAKPKAKVYMEKDRRWAGDWPQEWKDTFREARAFLLFMAETGYKSYDSWSKYAGWAAGHDKDADSMSKKITIVVKDFKSFNDAVGEYSAAWRDDASERKLKGIIDKAEKLRKNALVNGIEVLNTYRKKISDEIDHADRRPATIKSTMDKATESFKAAAEKAAKTFAGTKEFMDDAAKEVDALVERYTKSHGDLMKAVAPIIGDKPPFISDLSQFDNCAYSQLLTKADELIKTMKIEQTRRFGTKLVD